MKPPIDSVRYRLGCLLVLVGWLAAAPPCRADEPEIKVHIVAILATEKDKQIDPRLKDIAKKVQEKEPQLTGFQVNRCICAKLTAGKEETFKLVDNQTVTVLFKCKTDKDTRCCLTVKAPRMGEVTYNTTCEKFFPIVTRYQTKEKQRLILAIMVPPCEKKKK